MRNISFLQLGEDPEIFRTFVRARENKLGARRGALRGSDPGSAGGEWHARSEHFRCDSVRERVIAVGIIRIAYEFPDLSGTVDVMRAAEEHLFRPAAEGGETLPQIAVER